MITTRLRFGWIQLLILYATLGSCLVNVRREDDEKVVVGYYVPWGKLEPEQVPYSKLTHINYGFGILSNHSDPTQISIDRYYDGVRLRKLKKLAKDNNVKVLISLGGWTGGQTFSELVKEESLRQQFVENAVLFLRKNTLPEWEEHPNGWDLDGIDIDWEFPNRKGSKCNKYHFMDTNNYLKTLKLLKSKIEEEFPGQGKLITAAVRGQPFDDQNGKPLKDVSDFVPYFDFINIMAYDSMGPWSETIGPNAPFHLNRYHKDAISFTESIDSWLDANFPASKITAGIAFYGRGMTSLKDMSSNPSRIYVPKAEEIPKGDMSDSNEPNRICNEGSTYSGIHKYKYLRSDVLKEMDGTEYEGFKRFWDEETKTPWLFNNQTLKYISYDDPKSIGIKVDFINKRKLKGAMCWELSNDYNDELIDVLQRVRTKVKHSYNPYENLQNLLDPILKPVFYYPKK